MMMRRCLPGSTGVAGSRSSVLGRSMMSTAPAAAAPEPVPAGPPKRVTTQLKDMLESNSLEFLMEAHNGISAKIVEETGFKGIWASGLSVSAALGVRDSNEASWTQVLEQIEFMADSVNIPILLDGDTGYGNFNNARRLISKLESRGVAGVCLEDKLFPKTNSFIDGELQPLADINEFCGKIMACKDTQEDPDFNVVARLEAFITGYGLDEALKRADAYHRAGADAILCHSKKADDSDIADFMKEWGDRCPVVIVPTKYWQVPTETFSDAGVSMVIWANHNMRSAILSMQETTQSIYDTQSLSNVESDGKVVPVSEVFRLQNTAELKEAERKYEDVATVLRAIDETQDTRTNPQSFYRAMQEHGTNFFTGVPDSLLKNFCDFVTDNAEPEEHVIAANEGTAVGLAAGHHLATGEIPAVYLQNSGLGNIVNPVLSLADPKVYSIPMLLIIGWRGEPGKKDEPQHQVQGRVTPHMYVGCC
jgi:phosphoenolpyruvate mutase